MRKTAAICVLAPSDHACAGTSRNSAASCSVVSGRRNGFIRAVSLSGVGIAVRT